MQTLIGYSRFSHASSCVVSFLASSICAAAGMVSGTVSDGDSLGEGAISGADGASDSTWWGPQ